MFRCCLKKRVVLKLEPPKYVEPRVELVKYEQVVGDLCLKTPPGERISFLVVHDKEDNSKKSSDDETSVNHSILSGKNSVSSSENGLILRKEEDLRDKEIEPLFTVNISVKNERNGVLIHKKIYL